ncbi:MAG: S-adenosyl-l-methionine hydroxide adenosyltransferase family protein [Promethearchaeota archaeon]
MEGIIALLTDFGEKGQHYIAAMKAIILKINPRVKIIDLSHTITPFSILEALYILTTSYKYFPKGTIFVTVVDPGVGSKREILAIKTKSNYYFIGPNNGIFTNLLKSEIVECINIQNEEFYNHPVSSTFHGRDIMAPIAAYISKNEVFTLSNLGPNFDYKDIIKFSSGFEFDLEKGSIKTLIQYVDSFGNGTTTIQITKNKIGDIGFKLENDSKISLIIKGNKYQATFTSHFSSVSANSILLLVGSTGFLEISINQGNASKTLDFKVGDKILLNIEGV